MALSYIKDENDLYYESILDHLNEYNTTQTGEKESKQCFVFVEDNHELVGFVHASLWWDYIHYPGFFYDNQEALHQAISFIHQHFKEKAVGAEVSSFTDFVVEDFTKAGYQKVGYIENLPKHGVRTALLNQTLSALDMISKYQVTMTETFPHSMKEAVQKKKRAFLEKCQITSSFHEICYACFDNETLVGGVVGVLQFDNLYIDLLFVELSYRHQGIASNLMKLLEEEALNQGINQAYLGTTSFQAKDFYQRFGYEVKVALPNFPKGHTHYTMVKKLV